MKLLLKVSKLSPFRSACFTDKIGQSSMTLKYLETCTPDLKIILNLLALVLPHLVHFELSA